MVRLTGPCGGGSVARGWRTSKTMSLESGGADLHRRAAAVETGEVVGRVRESEIRKKGILGSMLIF
jgi:hypothetical protein